MVNKNYKVSYLVINFRSYTPSVGSSQVAWARGSVATFTTDIGNNVFESDMGPPGGLFATTETDITDIIMTACRVSGNNDDAKIFVVFEGIGVTDK